MLFGVLFPNAMPLRLMLLGISTPALSGSDCLSLMILHSTRWPKSAIQSARKYSPSSGTGFCNSYRRINRTALSGSLFWDARRLRSMPAAFSGGNHLQMKCRIILLSYTMRSSNGACRHISSSLQAARSCDQIPVSSHTWVITY